MALARHKAPKHILLRMLAVVAFGGVIWIATNWLHERWIAARTDAYVQEIILMLDLQSTPDFHQRIDKVRIFINDNSTHEVDATFWANHGNPTSFAAGLLGHAKGTLPERVHMECSTRTNLMGLILQALGYETRVVAIFNSRSNLKSHSFIDVMNPSTGGWETHDADYDIYWRSKVSGGRISLADRAEALEDIEPCGRASCGWQHESREGIKAERLRPYLEIISITAKQKAQRYTLYTSRADLSATYRKGSKQGKFCEVEAKRCKQGFFDITKFSNAPPSLPR